MKPKTQPGGSLKPVGSVTDAEIRKAVEADFQQWMIDSLTPDRGYKTPIDHVKALFRRTSLNARSKRRQVDPDDKKRLEWIDRRLGQIAIDVRQPKHRAQMRYYIELLLEEIRLTERFLSEDKRTS